MGFDRALLNAKMLKFNKQNTRTDALWKPTEGTSLIRIVPWVKNRDFPFIELHFHYLGGKTMISPLSFGRRDPIAEFADKLVEEARPLGRDAEKEAYGQSYTFRPKLRTYVPIIVRGEEDKGVRYWGFGKTVYQELGGIMNDPDWGDITDVARGRDITLEYIVPPKPEPGSKNKALPKTIIRPKPNQTPLVPDIELAKKLLNEQPDLYSLFPEPTFDEMRAALEKYLDPDDSAPTPKGSPDVESMTAQLLAVENEVNSSTLESKAQDALNVFDKLFND